LLYVAQHGEQFGGRLAAFCRGALPEARQLLQRVASVAGSLAATTDALFRASATSYDLLEETGVRTLLGRVRVARLREEGVVEVAEPSAARDVRSVADAMLRMEPSRS
jgi:hypothetical protein